MATSTYENIRVRSNVATNSILHIEFEELPNEHGTLHIRAHCEERSLHREQSDALFGSGITVYKATENEISCKDIIFAGVITEVIYDTTSGTNIVDITAKTGTIALDQIQKSRSFQDLSMTYAQVIRAVLGNSGAVIFAQNADIAINRPLFQYRETDWAFIRRLASHFYCSLYPNSQSLSAQFHFGITEDAVQSPVDMFASNLSIPSNSRGGETEDRSRHKNATVPLHTQINDCIGFDSRYFKAHAMDSGVSRRDFFYREIRCTYEARVGEFIQGCLIHQRSAHLQDGLLIFTYRLGSRKLGFTPKYNNQSLAGMQLIGTVIETNESCIKIQLDIDEISAATCWFSWTPITGNILYLMPPVGTRAHLHFQTADDHSAIAIESPRQNGGTCREMQDSNNRQLTTEHGKTLLLFPEEMALYSRNSGEEISFEDDKYLLFHSRRQTVISATEDITLQAPRVLLSSPSSVEIMKL